MTFSGYINIRQTGHAILHIDKYNEDYMFVVPDVKVKGFLSGHLYPEISGVYRIISSAGYISEIRFSGKGFFSGSKNSFNARIYRRDDDAKTSIYTVDGQWCDRFTIRDARTGSDVEVFSSETVPVAPIVLPELEHQDPWESRKAWASVIAALRKGDMQGTIKEKSRLEEAQRGMRKKDGAAKCWSPVFFSQLKGDYGLFDSLASATGLQLQPERTKGVWKYRRESEQEAEKPYHGELTPFG